MDEPDEEVEAKEEGIRSIAFICDDVRVAMIHKSKHSTYEEDSLGQLLMVAIF